MLIENRTQFICENVSRNSLGELCFAGMELLPLAKKYGTPLYLYDEARIRERCRTYLTAVKEGFGGRGKVLYASKAASFKRLYEIMNEEGMGIDVVSSGEIYSALSAGFPLENAYFHSNNKTDYDIEYAIENGIGYFVVDNAEELYAINRIAARFGVKQKVLLRLTPGIDPHTYAAVATGKVDSKFGSAIETGQAEEITKLALSLENVRLMGFHCHVGSQVFDSDVYLRAADVMLDFVAYIYKNEGFLAKELDIGGGYGVRYIESQPTIDIAKNIEEVARFMKSKAAELSIELPLVSFEPGRSIVADAGLTLYTVGTVKNIPGYKTYVSVDGGMTDNPRFALYGSPYTILPVMEDNDDNITCSVVGRCCESGDILQENVTLPRLKRGDIIACLTTGAYHYSMSSNYNRIPKPPVVMLSEGESYVAVRRQTVEDLSSLDV
ncbi:MAG: diaminopimelate decarboxylase [Ruminococcaceae bacterium]|nr:diaminopimelate decarboxylase [Oscillospiraceae bacterium]